MLVDAGSGTEGEEGGDAVDVVGVPVGKEGVADGAGFGD